MADNYCMWLRDAAGFCHLPNCWEGKPCPKSAAAAEKARQRLIIKIIDEVFAEEKAKLRKGKHHG